MGKHHSPMITGYENLIRLRNTNLVQGTQANLANQRVIDFNGRTMAK